MNTPVYDFLKRYADSDFSRFHMPGHKGQGKLCEALDITEIKGADSLFSANGIIAQSEKNASALFGSGKTLYSCAGSTLCINTMLALCCNGEDNVVVAVRNAHKAFVNSCVLIGARVKWVYPEYREGSITSGKYTPSDIENAILSCEKTPACVYITTPDYLGFMADIKAIAEVCHRNGVKLIIDNAHGAYLGFLDKSLHPLALGADMCCDSAHKTLPVLTGGAYLHISKDTDNSFMMNAKTTMGLFASTSPSYLILASLDLCNDYIDTSIRADLQRVIKRLDGIKARLIEKGIDVVGDEPLKLSIRAQSTGLSGTELSDILSQRLIECEYADKTHIVFMLSSVTKERDMKRLEDALLSFEAKKVITADSVVFPKPQSVMSMRKAVFSQSEEINITCASGRICSKVVIACPPGIPIVVPGEIIDESVIKIFQRYSIFTVNVVK